MSVRADVTDYDSSWRRPLTVDYDLDLTIGMRNHALGHGCYGVGMVRHNHKWVHLEG